LFGSRKNRAMRKPPIQKTAKDDQVKTALRLPVGLREEMKDAAQRAGHSLNDEILGRCMAASLADRLTALESENAEIKVMLREVLEAVSIRR